MISIPMSDTKKPRAVLNAERLLDETIDYTREEGGLSFEEESFMALSFLVLFWKFKVMPAEYFKTFYDLEFITYYYEGEPRLPFLDFFFVKLTYRGRKAAEEVYKKMKQMEGPSTKPLADPYLDEDMPDHGKFLMHHKRFFEEMEPGKVEKLSDQYYGIC